MLLVRGERRLNVFSLSTRVNCTLQCNSYFLYEPTDGQSNPQNIWGKRFESELLISSHRRAGQSLHRCGLAQVSAEASKEEKSSRGWGHRQWEPGLMGTTCRPSPSSRGKWSKLTLSACKTLRPSILKNSWLHCVSWLRCLSRLGEGFQVVSVRRGHGGAVGYPGCLLVRSTPALPP